MRSVLLLAILVGCSSPKMPPSTTPPPAAPPQPITNGSIPELTFFIGRWHATAHDPSTGKQFELDYIIAPALRGAWYIGTGSSAALGIEIHDLWGKDPSTGELVRTIFDSSGTFGTVRSRGWSGDTLIFEGPAASTRGSTTVRETIRRVGPDEFDAVWEMRTGETWTPYSVEKLRRVGPR